VAIEEETAVAPTATAEPTAEPTATAEPTLALSSLAIYEISQADSQVRFELDEELAGQPKTVVGVTDQVAGQLAVDLSDLASAQVVIIQVNARTLLTDNNFRNNAILNTNSYEFITFSPTRLEGLPASTAVGETVTFAMIGDLTIRDITNEVTFVVVATAVSPTQISGSASTIVARAAYNLVIPSVPQVANVEEEVELYIDFVANAVEG
jgi:polyisoprenoid-binding protein YceI